MKSDNWFCWKTRTREHEAAAARVIQGWTSLQRGVPSDNQAASFSLHSLLIRVRGLGAARWPADNAQDHGKDNCPLNRGVLGCPKTRSADSVRGTSQRQPSVLESWPICRICQDRSSPQGCDDVKSSFRICAPMRTSQGLPRERQSRSQRRARSASHRKKDLDTR